jgi:SAM-dependent methyltransferase
MNIVRLVSKYAPQPVLRVLRPIYRVFKDAMSAIAGVADSLRLIGPKRVYGEEYYAKRRDDPWRSDARRVSEAIKEYFRPNSVIDFGCAIGTHLEPFYESGATIHGVEGNPVAFEHAVVPEEYLEHHDLREPYEPDQIYDLVLCFEVAEHLPERFDDVFVDTLAESGDIVVMTAAPPGQGGTHHINEQNRDYWYEKFQSRGLEHDHEAVADLRECIEVDKTTWITPNLMVFRQSDQ